MIAGYVVLLRAKTNCLVGREPSSGSRVRPIILLQVSVEEELVGLQSDAVR